MFLAFDIFAVKGMEVLDSREHFVVLAGLFSVTFFSFVLSQGLFLSFLGNNLGIKTHFLSLINSKLCED